MISGAHMIIYSTDADADRTFFRDVLDFPCVDVGRGWLIFALPPSEAAVHPAGGEDSGKHEIYLMCDDLELTMQELRGKGVECAPVASQGWGLVTRIALPGGSKLGLYQPRHQRPNVPAS